MVQVKEIVLKGTPRERGYIHGNELKEEIHEFYTLWMKHSLEQASLRLDENDYLVFAKKHGPYIEEYDPGLYEEMRGIADGAKIDFNKVMFINCFDEGLESLMLPEVAVNMCSYPPMPSSLPLGGCTSFAAFGESTVDRKVYIGQGYDVGSVFFKPVVFKIVGNEEEPSQLVYSHAGVVGVSGINDAHLSIVENSMKPSDQRYGVPYPVVVRKALQQTILSDFVGVIIMAKRACGQNYIIGSSFTAVNLETSAEAYDFQYLLEGVFGHANHYESSALKTLDLWREWLPDTLIRSGRMNQLLKDQYGTLNLEALKNIMKDHANYPNSICRHEDQRGGVYSTLSALIYRPEDLLMLVSEGPPCANGYKEFVLSSG